METHGHADGREKQPVETLVEYGVLGTRYGTAHVPYQVHNSAVYTCGKRQRWCVWVWGCTYLDLLAQEKLSTHLEVVRHAQSQRGLGWLGFVMPSWNTSKPRSSLTSTESVPDGRLGRPGGRADMALKPTRGGPPLPYWSLFPNSNPPLPVLVP